MDPIFILTDENISNIKKENHCYIIAKNGIYYKDNQQFIETVTPVKQIHHLKNLKSFIKWKYPKINKYQFSSILKFFKIIYEKHDAECMVMIGFDRQKNQIVIFPPKIQSVSKARISYKNESNPGISIIGTIHSHNSMGAFHSGTDVADEMDFEGLHITIGRLNKQDDSFEISSELSSSGFRQKINYSDIIEGIIEKQEVKSNYINFDKKEKQTENKSIFNKFFNFGCFDIFERYTNSSKAKAINYSKKLYSEIDINSLSEKNMKIIESWITTVKVNSYTSYIPKNIATINGKKYVTSTYNDFCNKEKLFEDKIGYDDDFFIDDEDDMLFDDNDESDDEWFNKYKREELLYKNRINKF